MFNSGKKPIERKLEEARSKLFTEETFKELLKPEFMQKAFDSTFICVMISMILHYFMKSEQHKQSIQLFIDYVVENTKENLEAGDKTDLNKSLVISHPFTHRMVLSAQQVKKFIQGFSTAPEELKADYEQMIEQLVQLLVDNLSVLLETRSVFVYVALMENTSYSKRVAQSHPDRTEDQEPA